MWHFSLLLSSLHFSLYSYFSFMKRHKTKANQNEDRNVQIGKFISVQICCFDMVKKDERKKKSRTKLYTRASTKENEVKNWRRTKKCIALHRELYIPFLLASYFILLLMILLFVFFFMLKQSLVTHQMNEQSNDIK